MMRDKSEDLWARVEETGDYVNLTEIMEKGRRRAIVQAARAAVVGTLLPLPVLSLPGAPEPWTMCVVPMIAMVIAILVEVKYGGRNA